MGKGVYGKKLHQMFDSIHFFLFVSYILCIHGIHTVEKSILNTGILYLSLLHKVHVGTVVNALL